MRYEVAYFCSCHDYLDIPTNYCVFCVYFRIEKIKGKIKQPTQGLSTKRVKLKIENLRSGPRVVNTGGDEHAATAIDDDGPVVIAHIKRLEELCG